MNKRLNKIIKFENITDDVRAAIIKNYPDGWEDYIFKVDKPNGDYFYAFTVNTPDISYLIKVNVEVDTDFDIEKLNYDIPEAAVDEKQDDTEDTSDDDDDNYN